MKMITCVSAVILVMPLFLRFRKVLTLALATLEASACYPIDSILRFQLQSNNAITLETVRLNRKTAISPSRSLLPNLSYLSKGILSAAGDLGTISKKQIDATFC